MANDLMPFMRPIADARDELNELTLARCYGAEGPVKGNTRLAGVWTSKHSAARTAVRDAIRSTSGLSY